MADVELAVTRCKRLESMLEQGLGATGRGLHEKLTSVESRLPGPLVKKIRYVATVRNKLVHEADVDRLDDRAGFRRACDEAERQLIAVAPSARLGGRGWASLFLKLAGAAALAAAGLGYALSR